jgi:hypothetical protein
VLQSESMMGATYACFQIANKGIYQFAFGQVFWMSLSRYNWLGSASISLVALEVKLLTGDTFTRRGWPLLLIDTAATISTLFSDPRPALPPLCPPPKYTSSSCTLLSR